MYSLPTVASHTEVMANTVDECRSADRNDHPVLEQQRPHLVDDRRALDDEPTADAVQGL